MVKTAMFADNDDAVLDRRCRPGLFGCILPVLRTNTLRKRKGGYGRAEQQSTKPARKRCLQHGFLLWFFECVRREDRSYTETMTLNCVLA
ncbi:hypothetical protein GALL_412600 [mine drainage metagenome]|uniref:Uncharacterized protein n=1 Tax=mine drainage metagenome TaxID=410659 RepID=A0A1J5QHQ4_9ZZZZ